MKTIALVYDINTLHWENTFTENFKEVFGDEVQVIFGFWEEYCRWLVVRGDRARFDARVSRMPVKFLWPVSRTPAASSRVGLSGCGGPKSRSSRINRRVCACRTVRQRMPINPCRPAGQRHRASP